VISIAAYWIRYGKIFGELRSRRQQKRTQVSGSVRCCCSTLNETCMWRQMLTEILNIKFNGNYCSDSRVSLHAGGRADGRTDVTKVT
jgi:hypothetical protein